METVLRRRDDNVVTYDETSPHPAIASERASNDFVAYSPKMQGPKYPPHDASAPILEGVDYPAYAVAIVMALGPLSAYAGGFGL